MISRQVLTTFRLVVLKHGQILINSRCATIWSIGNKFITINHIRNMAQKSITSFFKITPKKETNNDEVNKVRLTPKVVDNKEVSTPNGIDQKSSKRQRIESSGSESPPQKEVSDSIKTKKKKRQRIESSESEADIDSKSPEYKIVVKNEKQSPESSPKSKNSPSKKLVLAETKKDNIKKSSKTSKVKKASSEDNTQKNSKVKKESSNKEEKGSKVKDENEEENFQVVSDEHYEPDKHKYHPIRDACWSAGQEVPYLALAQTFEAIEATSSRLKTVEILSNYLRSVIALTPQDLLPSIYMCLNQLAPAYVGLELGIAETYLVKAVSRCTGQSAAQVRGAAARAGSLAAAARAARARQQLLSVPGRLTLRAVFQAFTDIANMTGHASMEKKICKIQSLYVACRHSEAKYLIRSLEGKLRIGLAEQSVLQALGQAAATTPPRPDATGPVLDASQGLAPDAFKAVVDETVALVKRTYSECPDYGLVVGALLQHGVAGLELHCPLRAGLPLKPMLAHPTRAVAEVFTRFEGVPFTCEWKYDGERAQLHVPATPCGARADLPRAAIYSRNQEDHTGKYPDVVARLPELLKESVTSCVLDCEVVAYDTATQQILPFQVLSRRKRKAVQAAEVQVQVCVFVFDVLLLNGEPLVRRTELRRRAALLRDHFREHPGTWQFARSRECSTGAEGELEQVQEFLEEAVRGSCEGLMLKALEGPRSYYDIARRSHNWLKLKKDYLEGAGDSVDVVVVGGWWGRGRRAGVLGGFLVCARAPPDELHSLCRLGTGLSDDELRAATAQLLEHRVDGPKPYYRFDETQAPEVWFEPAVVWEVRCADLSLSPAHRSARGLLHPDKGISLRFPRYVRARPDKSWEQATTAQQLVDLYLAQDVVKNAHQHHHHHHHEDDFY